MFVNDMINYGLIGKKLTNMEFIKGKYKTHGPPEHYKKFSKLFPLKLVDIRSHGKLIIFEFSDDVFLLSNLGLTGMYNFTDPDNKVNVILSFGNKRVYYFDQLSFGSFRIIWSLDELETIESKLGPDVIQDDISFSEFKNVLLLKRNLKKQIADVIVDQKNFAGIGNYLRSEILYAAKVYPLKRVHEMDDKELKRVYTKMLNVTRLSYNDLGVEKYNNKGTFTLKVYQQKKDPHGNDVEIITSSGRSIYWVPAIQMK